MERQPERTIRVAIIGGGFSGTAVLANLVSRLPAGSAIDMFDARGAFAVGSAYATNETVHLLNVPAGKMGVFAADGFTEWLNTPDSAAAVGRLRPGMKTGPREFLPRALYGQYLQHILDRALAAAADNGIAVTLSSGAVIDVRCRKQRLELQFAKGPRSTFDAVVLATGNPSPDLPAGLSPKIAKGPGYVADLWSSQARSALPERVARLRQNDTVMILGSGLTAVDAILSLRTKGFAGKIVALSRHGRLPAAQASAAPAPWAWRVAPHKVASSAVAVVHWLKTEARAAIAAGSDWRAVFDALRPVTPRLWQELDPAEQKKLLRRHSLWSIHRHRMAPEVAEEIAALRANGRLEVRSGRIVSARRWFGRWRVRIRERGLEAVLRPALILNCTGPQYDVAGCGSALFRNLLRRGIVHASENGLGLAINPHGAVRGLGEGRIFAIGTLLFGERFECTAVPELREAARWIAGQVAALAPVRELVS